MKKYDKFVNGWLYTTQGNENGSSNGGFNGETNKWEAHVYLKDKNSNKPSKHYYYTSISHWKVHQWLEKMRKENDLQ